MNNVTKVGMADYNTVEPPKTIRTLGLGSCVGIVLYDERTLVAGMAHIMLPDSTQATSHSQNRAKYADTAISDLIEQMVQLGAKVNRLYAKIAGGAQMFTFSQGVDMMRIGPRNVEAVKRTLAEYKIPIKAEDVGGKSGRTIEFNPTTKKLQIRTVHAGTKEI
ncbi:chemotaxis protein CheD [Alkalihalobacillus alcalophilus ATCC 27647 = CGMCC 1.3604]|uniref:Probable chemoreceptor glutamine deamidase CheD n=1 Tax=Alkalihalobacillus alcalophilus ATCC 27647 = CGMCC 1.3604 TaxID=1218173 RepID=A0A094WQF3_ALKAL|nr:chemotaxis protein CheD [Alkalihalobacillus alcalophilus]KGA98228.1 chemotaxis protein CheD [Alkalihalobacillus alcalophilus ATCC 27647 = CGMCC 1.3604]MED1562168.1 chemotaxis protein CheD [Alkalihalobacillus alcalophilus]THG91393.1 chemotaxis protein CheD [Alkalihalobacillus alcalophilus ATCC 27647 = CGMCC 1.3604]